MTGERDWGPEDRTGGRFDEIVAYAREAFLDASIHRYVPKYPADDDNVYWFRLGSIEVQVDTAEAGGAPFIVESDRRGSRLDTSDLDSAWRHLSAELSGNWE